MLLNKQQLTQSLLQLVQGDYDLLDDIMNEYVESIDDKRFEELESYVNNNLGEIIWGFLLTTVMLLNVIIAECNFCITMNITSNQNDL